MADSREEYLTELYMGFNVMLSNEFTQVPFLEFKTRQQHTSTDDLRLQVLELRKILNNK